MPRLVLLTIVYVISTVSITAAQDHLIPETGLSGELGKYDIALHNVFAEGYSNDVKLRMLVRPSFGKEFMVGLKSESSGYHLFSLIPDSSIWYSSWKSVPCSELHQTVSISRKDKSRTCEKLDFSDTSLINTSITYIPFDSTKAELLEALWQEMLLDSKYSDEARLVTDGISYHFSAFVFGRGTLTGYAHSPAESTKPSKLANIGWNIYLATKVDSVKQRNQLVDSVYIKSQKLMKEVLDDGSNIPQRQYVNRMLSGCVAEQLSLFESEYCWQSQLDYDVFPEFITANRIGDNYTYELLDFKTDSTFRSITILPVVSLYSHYSNKSGNFSTSKEEYFILNPWDIGDINLNSYNNQLQVFGFRDFTINNKNLKSELKLGVNTILIAFEGIQNRNSYKKNLKIEGQHGWFTLEELFKGL